MTKQTTQQSIFTPGRLETRAKIRARRFIQPTCIYINGMNLSVGPKFGQGIIPPYWIPDTVRTQKEKRIKGEGDNYLVMQSVNSLIFFLNTGWLGMDGWNSATKSTGAGWMVNWAMWLHILLFILILIAALSSSGYYCYSSIGALLMVQEHTGWMDSPL